MPVCFIVQAISELSYSVISIWRSRCQDDPQLISTPWLDDSDVKLLSILFAYHKHELDVVEEYQRHAEMLLCANSNLCEVKTEARTSIWLAVLYFYSSTDAVRIITYYSRLHVFEINNGIGFWMHWRASVPTISKH